MIRYLFFGSLYLYSNIRAQDTFSIVAVDSSNQEVGSAGASCVDLIANPKEADFIGELFPGKGAINTQASYDEFNQGNAAQKMNEDSTPAQIINWLSNNDVNNTPQVRQYGIAALVKGKPQTAGFTGTSCLNWKGHIAGPNYCIQGNILLGQQVLDSIEARFVRTKGDLKTKLMAALQGAKMVGADTRCAPNNSSTLFAFLKVAKPTDADGSNPSFMIKVKTRMNDKIEPIDSLQKLFDAKTKISDLSNKIEDQVDLSFKNGQLFLINKYYRAVYYQITTTVGQIVQTGRIQKNETIMIEPTLLSSCVLITIKTEEAIKQTKILCQSGL